MPVVSKQQTLLNFFAKRAESDISPDSPEDARPIPTEQTLDPTLDKPTRDDLPKLVEKQSSSAEMMDSDKTSSATEKGITKASGCLWSADEVKDFVTSVWPTQKCHNYFICGTICDSVSTNEQERLTRTEEGEKKMGTKRPDKLRHEWLLKRKYWSICYVEEEGFYCVVCKKFNSKNSQNKSQIFVQQPSIRFKDEALKSHIESEAHTAAIEADIMQSKSCFHKIYVEKKTVEKSVLVNAFSTVYFLMKEYIANRKFIPFINFMEKVIGVKEFQYFDHRSDGSIQDIFRSVGYTVKESVLRKARTAKSFGIMIDEVTDISVTSQLVTFIQFWDRDTQSMTTEFLSSQNVLEKFESCNSYAITELVKTQLLECNLEITKLMGLSTDGASVMVGKNNGVAAQLRQTNDKLINIHCVCHRLALACTDTCNHLTPIKQAEDVLKQLWYYFQNSPKRLACFLKTQLALRLAEVQYKENTIKFLCRRLKKACQTRWLSFDSSVTSALRDYEAIVLTLQHLDDATALGLLMKMKAVKFLGVLYILRCILPILSILSKQFQADCFHFSMVKPAACRAIAALDEIAKSQKPLNDLQSNIDSFTSISDDLRLRKDDSQQLESLLSKYIDKLKTNISDRLGSVPEIIEAYGVFDPQSVPPEEDAQFKEYGVVEMKVLAEHFWPGDKDKENKLKYQWSQSKYYIVSKKEFLKKQIAGCQSSTVFMCHIVKNEGIFSPLLFEELLFVAEVGLSLPCSNAWPERGGSVIKLTKTKCRNRLGNVMLNSLMQVSINGPEIVSEEAQGLVKEAVDSWLSEKKRKKLKRKRTSTVLEASSHSSVKVCTEESVESEEVETDNPENVFVENSDCHSDNQAVEIQAIASAVGLEDTDCDSAFESDFEED